MTKTSGAHRITPSQRKLLDGMASGQMIVARCPINNDLFRRYHRDGDGEYRAGDGVTPQITALLRAGLVKEDAKGDVAVA